MKKTNQAFSVLLIVIISCFLFSGCNKTDNSIPDAANVSDAVGTSDDNLNGAGAPTAAGIGTGEFIVPTTSDASVNRGFGSNHSGIDYAAPAGTPVKSVGNGVITYRGKGKGEGNYIIIRHANSYETLYMHLASFARGQSKGSTVRQGEIIGYVGSTGDATGPHLDFRMKKNGTYINPLRELSPRSEPVSAGHMPAYLHHVAVWREYLDGTKNTLSSSGRHDTR